MKTIQINVLTKTVIITALLALVSVIGFGTAFGYGVTTGSKIKKSSSSRSAVVANNGGQVLGEQTFVFTTDLSMGMQSNDVMELQKRLRAEGFFNFLTNTGYFGPITFEAVKQYQAAHPTIGYVTGFVGPLTRAELNK